MGQQQQQQQQRQSGQSLKSVVGAFVSLVSSFASLRGGDIWAFGGQATAVVERAAVGTGQGQMVAG